MRGGCTVVDIYTTDHRLVATHDKADKPGQRRTNFDHLPPHKVPGVVVTREICREKAAAIGPSTLKVVECLLAHRPEDRLRAAARVLSLAERFSPERLEAACRRAVAFDEMSYMSIKSILKQGLDAQPYGLPSAQPRALAYVRSPEDLVGHLTGGVTWK